MNNICTNLEQSKKLIELRIDISTADMLYRWHDEQWYCVPKDVPYPYSLKDMVPAWSLSALINIIPQELFDGEYIIDITEGVNHKWVISYDPPYEISSYLSASDDNLIDCCVKMIIKLKERNLL